ncbi:MAG: DUF1934 domain-containing protein [Eubacteriales bacterium]|nr:DUF1934 domain-containing protein [Eubacteriales bacterium]
MEGKPILITLNASSSEGEEDSMNLMTSGELFEQQDGVLLRYEESIDETQPPQQVELTLQSDRVTMNRTGAVEAKMIFQKGQRYESLYHTPYGTMEMAIYCTKARCHLAEKGGDMQLQYQLDLGGQYVAMHVMNLQYVVRNA